MTYIVGLDAYRLHPGDENVFKTLLMYAKVWHYLHMTWVQYNLKLYLYTYVNDYVWM